MFLRFASICKKNNTLFQVDLEQFVAAGVSCLKPEFIAGYLTDHPTPLVEDYLIPEVCSTSGATKR